ncbi:MAG: hypothetical protein EOP14_00475 [Pseudomonas sp.]|nr:MAG: hypothetical protein EOP14_00475 [Pseudomonas sp.]
MKTEIVNGISKEGENAASGKKRLPELRAIEWTLQQRDVSNIGPRVFYSKLYGILTCGSAAFGFFALYKAGFDISPAVACGVTFASYVLAYKLSCRYSSHPWTYTEKLDAQLAKYNPVGKEAYRDLQVITKETGRLDTDNIHKWVELERRAIQLASGASRPQGFIDKII